MHPLNQILKYHCRELIVPNTFGTPALVNEAQFMDLLFAYGNDGAIRLLRDAHPFSTWDITDFRRSVKVQLVKYFFFAKNETIQQYEGRWPLQHAGDFSKLSGQQIPWGRDRHKNSWNSWGLSLCFL